MNARSRLAPGVAREVIDSLDIGVMVTSPRFERIHFCSAVALEMLQAMAEPEIRVPPAVVDALRTRRGDPLGAAFTSAVRVNPPRGRSFYVRARLLWLRSPKVLLTMSPAIIRERVLQDIFATRFGLSVQHAKVVAQLRRGLNNKDIARQLGLSPVTVKHYVSEAIAALGVRNRVEVVTHLEKFESAEPEGDPAILRKRRGSR